MNNRQNSRFNFFSGPAFVTLVIALSGILATTAAEFVVTTTADSGAGSLRQAILDANALPGHDGIIFNIPGSGVHSIKPETELPEITDTVTIDGYTQPNSMGNTLLYGFNGILLIELNGEFLSGAEDGLRLLGGNSLVRGAGD